MAASVISHLWWPGDQDARHRQQLVMSAQAPRGELLDCNRDVSRLLESLVHEASALISLEPSQRRAEVGTRWTQFSSEWKHTWSDVDARCGFSELHGRGVARGYDRMAQVHADLPEAHLRYANLIRRFDNEQAGQLTQMRRALEKSRRTLERRTR